MEHNMNNDDELAIISLKLYKELLEDQKILDALHSHGVDNWEGYDDAMAGVGDDE